MEKTCTVCHKPFTTSRASSEYCSRECYFESKRGKPSPLRGRGRETRTCPVCGTEFEVGGRGNSQKKRIYCSRRCSSQRQSIAAGRFCEICGKPCGAGKKKYCSRECYFEHQRRTTGERFQTFVCGRCGKEFQRFVSQRRGVAVYCSAECRAAGRVYPTGEQHPQWRGGTFERGGYVWELDRNKPRKPDGGYRYTAQHIRVAEETLGRPLVKGEHVHHLNGIHDDNRPENLLVLDGKQHLRLHGFYSQQFQIEHEAKGDLEQITVEFLNSLE